MPFVGTTLPLVLLLQRAHHCLDAVAAAQILLVRVLLAAQLLGLPLHRLHLERLHLVALLDAVVFRGVDARDDLLLARRPRRAFARPLFLLSLSSSVSVLLVVTGGRRALPVHD
eukprot:Amastigsp_a6289_131.p2 type:complete len:114 gc:universal Amastigsp_a6289_131:207-548(+)